MATADELKSFLTKRGFLVDIAKNDEFFTYTIKVFSKSVDDVAQLIAQIEEPGRFVVSMNFAEVTNFLTDSSGLKEQITLVDSDLRSAMTKNMEQLTKTDEELARQGRDSISGLHQTIKELESKIISRLDDLDSRLAVFESQPWWKRFTGVK